MISNTKALYILLALVLSSVAIFCIEKQFLKSAKRGSTISRYEKIPWIDKIRLLVDDFEELVNDKAALRNERFFSYGGAGIALDSSLLDRSVYAGRSAIKVTWSPGEKYGGWGKGVGENLDLDAETDYFNFRIFIPGDKGDNEDLEIIIEEDDNDDHELQKEKDDQWSYTVKIPPAPGWQFISIPLKLFSDSNEGGDHVFNVTRKGGIHTLLFSFPKPDKYVSGHSWYFDFIFFSETKPNFLATTKGLN